MANDLFRGGSRLGNKRTRAAIVEAQFRARFARRFGG